MRKLEEIEEDIQRLSGSELAKFRKWYAEFDAHAWDEQFEADVKAGKLDAPGEAARRARREGKNTELRNTSLRRSFGFTTAHYRQKYSGSPTGVLPK